tara:strand:+ start:1063 stop:1743 length:681 start_codon:yes stop_codon:yes gene_type:complete
VSDSNHIQEPEVKTIRKRSYLSRVRNYFLTGIIVTAPIAITFTVAMWVINWIDSKVVPLIPPDYNPQVILQNYTGIHVPGIGLVVVLIGLTVTGFLAAGLLGKFIVRVGENLLSRMPIIRSIYGALKQIFETVLRSSSRSFREVALIEYPRRGIWAIGFITTKTTGEVRSEIKEDVVNIFLPTTPNPTSGFLLFVPRKDLIVLDMGVEEAIKMIVSAGIVTPPSRK